MAGIKGRSGGSRPGAGRKVGSKQRRDADPGSGGAREDAGRKPFAPTDGHRGVVERAAAYGIPFEKIRLLIINPTTNKPIDTATLHAHFQDELDGGPTRANVSVANALYKSAMKGNVAAQKFYLEAKAKWSTNVNVTVRRPEEMSDEELDAALAAFVGNEPFGEGAAASASSIPRVRAGESPTRH